MAASDRLWGVDLESVASEWKGGAKEPPATKNGASSWWRFAVTVAVLVLSCVGAVVLFRDYLSDILLWFERYVPSPPPLLPYPSHRAVCIIPSALNGAMRSVASNWFSFRLLLLAQGGRWQQADV